MAYPNLRPLGNLVCLGLSVVALNACTVLGPDYEEPDADLQAQWSEIETPTLETDHRPTPTGGTARSMIRC